MKEVHWKSLKNGVEGNGEPKEDNLADEQAEVGNLLFLNVYYWTVRVL